MPCTKCKGDFNVLNWKFKCGDCNYSYCTKCLRKSDGVFYCDKCLILMKRPPDREQLMELKSKDIQDYLHRNNVSTYGLVEKQELIEVFCRNPIPVYPKRGTQKLTANLGGSVPNLAAKPQAFLNNLRANVENAINSQLPRPPSGTFSATTSPTREAPRPRPRPPRPPPPRASQPTTSTEPPAEQDANDKPDLPKEPKYPKLSDFGSADDLNALSAKQLKELLTLNRVNYKGCVEKSELLERANRLWEDSNKQKDALPEEVDDLCKLCMDAPLDCVLLECGHIATCIDCGKRLAECPICRQYVIRVVRTFKA